MIGAFRRGDQKVNLADVVEDSGADVIREGVGQDIAARGWEIVRIDAGGDGPGIETRRKLDKRWG
jgi:hypothetical protein